MPLDGLEACPILILLSISLLFDIIIIIASITKFSIVIGSGVPICHVNGVRSRGCPI